MTEILFAAFARTPRGRELLADDLRATLPATFPAAARSFWVCRDAGVALHAQPPAVSAAVGHHDAPIGEADDIDVLLGEAGLAH